MRPPTGRGPRAKQKLRWPNVSAFRTLTRAAAYESLYAKAQAQDAPFRERLAREEREKSAESSASLTESTGKPAPSIDNPERDPEAPRTYWTEVPRFFTTWQRHTDKWWGKWPMESTSRDQWHHFDVSSEKRAGRQMRWLEILDPSHRLATLSNKLSEKILNEDGWQGSSIAPKVESV